MRYRLTAAVYLACAVAQTPPAFHSKVELVTISCAVVDGDGARIAGLTRDEFRVYDNGAPRKIEHLWLDTDQPLTLGVIIDDSESQQEQRSEHRHTTSQLLAQILRPGDRAFVIFVNDEIRIWADLSDDPAAIAAQMENPPGELLGKPCPIHQQSSPGSRAIPVCGSSPLWNAIYEAARLKLRPLTGNKGLLILTDGFDTGSTHTWRQAADEVHKAESTVYAIQYRSGFGGSYAPDLYRLVYETGGVSFQAPHGDYSAIVSRVNTDLRGRYVLGFRPEQVSGKPRHEVRVEVTRPDLTVRSRKTYFRAPQ